MFFRGLNNFIKTSSKIKPRLFHSSPHLIFPPISPQLEDYADWDKQKKENSSKTVVVGISGGVDSAVATGLLLDAGYNVIPVYMTNWDQSDELGVCTAEKDLFDARNIASHFGLELKEVNYVKDYWNNVFENLLQGYIEGQTPNPDLNCNKYIKFGCFFKYATEDLKADYVATGHYARILYPTDISNGIISYSANPNLHNTSLTTHPLLTTSKDRYKDQTYFLASINKSTLDRVLFPLGNFKKPQVRAIAQLLNIPVASKRDSQGICFVGKKRRFNDFMLEYLPKDSNKTGYIVNLDDFMLLSEQTNLPDINLYNDDSLQYVVDNLYLLNVFHERYSQSETLLSLLLTRRRLLKLLNKRPTGESLSTYNDSVSFLKQVISGLKSTSTYPSSNDLSSIYPFVKRHFTSPVSKFEDHPSTSHTKASISYQTSLTHKHSGLASCTENQIIVLDSAGHRGRVFKKLGSINTVVQVPDKNHILAERQNIIVKQLRIYQDVFSPYEISNVHQFTPLLSQEIKDRLQTYHNNLLKNYRSCLSMNARDEQCLSSFENSHALKNSDLFLPSLSSITRSFSTLFPLSDRFIDVSRRGVDAYAKLVSTGRLIPCRIYLEAVDTALLYSNSHTTNALGHTKRLNNSKVLQDSSDHNLILLDEHTELCFRVEMTCKVSLPSPGQAVVFYSRMPESGQVVNSSTQISDVDGSLDIRIIDGKNSITRIDSCVRNYHLFGLLETPDHMGQGNNITNSVDNSDIVVGKDTFSVIASGILQL